MGSSICFLLKWVTTKMLHKWIAVAAVLAATAGCDDATVHELITSNFVCVYMPYWMGECDSTEMQAKAQSVLTNGIVEARIECTIDVGSPIDPFVCGSSYPQPWSMTYGASLLAEGSKFVSFAEPGTSYTRLYSRSEVSSELDRHVPNNPLGTCSYTSVAANDPETDYTRISIVDGHVAVSYCDAWVPEFPLDYGPGWIPQCPYMPGCPDPGCVAAPVTSTCTGFNLAAFGVSE